jgi:histidine triad (HIT) family protein
MTEDSIFTKIIKGEIPSCKIYEDELTIAIMSLHQLALGMVLVIPKKQVDQFFELPETDYQALMLTVQKVAKRMKEVIKSKRVGVKIEGLDIPHVHVKLLAFDNHEQFDEIEDPTALVDHQLLKEIAEKLAF